ncbi:MAG: 3-oxoacid CoA-transferase [Clostridiales Family XIII bacterium]|jgi:propionate CoA-transferase|nr:3-oxoacid CoA-transferase [Clostridiales Family XIII bacterium]
MPKFVTAAEAVSVIQNDAAVIVGGFGSYSSAEELLQALADRYEAGGSPRNLTVIAGIVPGDKTERTEPMTGYNIGLNRLKAEGLVGTVKVGLLNDARAFSWAVGDNKIAGYLLPMGVLISLFHTAAGGGPGFLTKVGLGTYCDPRQEGCMVNDKAREQGEIVERMEIDGEEYLFYKSFKPDVCLIRATYADEDGNLSMDHEAVLGAELDMAIAVHNNGGIVIAQVEDVVGRGTIHPKNVRIHGKLVDYVVKATDPDHHRQCIAFPGYRPELSGDIRTPSAATAPLPMGVRKLITRRAAMELKPGIIINLGVGMPSGIGSVAAEEGLGAGMTMSIEAGPMGGVVQEGLGFPAAANPDAIFTQTDMINMYHGGILDMTILGAAEIDAKGNVNVSKFGGRSNGPGGFIDISQNTKAVVFMGNFTAGKSDIEVTEDGLVIKSDGDGIKFVKKLQQITFSGEYAIKSGRIVKFITERAVFELSDKGLVLTEIAPGVDFQKAILDKMEFLPIISETLKPMDARLFRQE